MDILRFIDSKDMRDHFMSIGYRFSTVEADFIVWQSGIIPLKEKISAWREIIETMPDQSLPPRGGECFIESFHAMLSDYIKLIEKQLDEFLSSKTFHYVIDSSFYPGDGFTSDEYDDFEKMFDDIRTDIIAEQQNPDDSSDTRKYPCLIRVFGGNGTGARLNDDLEITGVHSLSGTLDEMTLSGMFSRMWFAFPSPFRRGDVLTLRSVPPHFDEPRMHFIVDRMSYWSSAELIENGFPADSDVVLNADKRVDELAKNGTARDMTAEDYIMGNRHESMWYLSAEKDDSFNKMCTAVVIGRESNILRAKAAGKKITCCFTGHREFPWGSNTADARHKTLLAELEKAVDTAISKGITHFICGNAVGFDTWAAQIILKKKKTDPRILLEIAIPFEGHNIFDKDCIDVQNAADIVHVVSDAKSHKDAYSERNRYMVLHSDMLIAALDDSHRRSGTVKTVEFAARRGLDILRLKV